MRLKLSHDWLFHRGDLSGAERLDFDDSGWETVSVPHDWAIRGPFDKTLDIQYARVVQDGETKKKGRHGRTGALPHIGVGWYRFHWKPEQSAAQYLLEFDGVMSHSEIWVNGKYAGGRIFGYSAFRLDITKQIDPARENCIAVRVDNPENSSRWYPGAGIYRDVFLYCNPETHFEFPRIHVQIPFLAPATGKAVLQIELFAENFHSACMTLKDPAGKVVKKETVCQKKQSFELDHVSLWSPETPALYRLETVLLDAKGEPADPLSTAVGFRKAEFSAEKGMFLNGRPYKLNGVCLHHDQGALGAAFHRSAMIHQLKLLKSIGCNAIRTSHNPPASALLDLCDEMGFAVMDEAFDAWTIHKTTNDYAGYFESEHERDLRDFMFRDRNHPCVLFWSLGNEIDEQNEPEGYKVLQRLIREARQYDSRPLTCGMNYAKAAVQNHFAEQLDLCGWNYKPHLYAEFHQALPDKPQFGSETASVVSSRGIYRFPVMPGPQTFPDGHCVSYDLQYMPWSQSADTEFSYHRECPWIFGEFVWTGFDYLGEPSPYNDGVPFARSSYFGIFDLAALPKDRVWLYRAAWTDKPVVHLLPHWTWPEYTGQTIPVHVYTNAFAAELFLNGESLGLRRREEGIFRLIWDNVVYEPGTLLVKAFDAEGNLLGTDERRTAGPFAALRIESSRPALKAGSEDLAYLTITLTDGTGTPVPSADDEITAEVTGSGTLKALCNGDPTSLRSFYEGHLPAFSGMLTAIVAAGNQSGTLRIKAFAAGGISQELELPVQ